MQPLVIDPELKLLARACATNFQNASETEHFVEPVDWTRLFRLASRHRIEGLAYLGLRKFPGAPFDTLESLAKSSRQIAAKSLQAIDDCFRLRDAFVAERIPMLFVKGSSLARLAYRSPFAKQSKDIDILVGTSDVSRAALLLGNLKFTPAPPVTVATATRWHRRMKESEWARSDGRQIDLHGRLANSPKLIPGLGVESPYQEVEIAPGETLRTLANDELGAYLAVHGASSAWFRLKWVADFAAPLVGCEGSEIERRYRCWIRLGAGRTAGQALLVADALFTLPLSLRLRGELNGDRVIRLLVSSSLKALVNEREPTERRFGTMAMHAIQLTSLPGVSFAVREAARQLSEAWTVRRFNRG